MSPLASKRLLQATIAVLALIPLATGASGVLLGPDSLVEARAGGRPGGWPRDFDSHYRYLSGIFLGLGIVFYATIPGIERKTGLFRLAAALVVAGGLGRLLSLLSVGAPTAPHLAGLGLELVGVPLIALWQARLAKRF